MAVEFRFSDSYSAKTKRIKRLPVIVNQMLFAFAKKDALTMIKNFHDGIKYNSFKLEKLSDGTIIRKSAAGDERPRTPLYAAGDSKKDNSYVNCLRLRMVKDGWKVRPSRAKHYSGKMKLNDLMDVHENGTLISHPSGALIRIPPRPAFFKAFARTLNQKRSGETSKEVRAAMAKYVRTGRAASSMRAASKLEAKLKKFDKKE